MKKIEKYSYFADINEVPCEYPWLSFDEECDVLVIGGGVTGCEYAYKLSSKGIDTILVSKKPIGFTSSCTSTAILQYQNEFLLTRLSEKIGKERAVEFYEQNKLALDEIEKMASELESFDFKRQDSFIFTNSTEVDLNTEYLMRRHYDYDVSLIEKFDKRIDFSFEYGILAKNEAAVLDPYKFCQVLADEAELSGGKIYENTIIQNIAYDNNKYIATTNYGKKIEANKI